MRLALVSMPWAQHDCPSAAVAALAAYVRRERPSATVETFSEHARVAVAMGFPLYDLLSHRYSLGELLAVPDRYPERHDAVRERFLEEIRRHDVSPPAPGPSTWEAAFDHVREVLARSLDGLVSRLAGRFDVVGLTVNSEQLFQNLALCRRLRAKAPGTFTLLGGALVSDRVAESVLAEFPEVDAVVQGEGELPLVALLDALERRPEGGGPPTLAGIPGIVHRGGAGGAPSGGGAWEVPRLGDLPYPDYDEYARVADESGIDWQLWIEGSRGCWWDRSKRTKDPRKACAFCTDNSHWNGYREKAPARLVRELEALSDRHEKTEVYFLDSILRSRGIPELARRIGELGKDFAIFYAASARIRPADLVAMWEAGLSSVLFGIEGLSSAFLSRVGKGTTTIQNLQVMKLCAELGIANDSALILGFPGSTAEEVEETRRNILRFALPYEPCLVTLFHLGMGSAVEALPGEYGISRTRTPDCITAVLPEGVRSRLALRSLDFDQAPGTADWSPVRDAVETWRRRQEEVNEPLLRYFDGGTFLTIIDRREGYQVIHLRSYLREIYLYCAQIRKREQILRRFQDAESEATVLEGLAGLVADGLVFEERDCYLSLALALRPALAAKRIKEAEE